MKKSIPLILLVALSCQTKQTKESDQMNNPSETQNLKAELFLKIEATLGEGPIWNYLTNELYWIDIEGKKLHILDPKTKGNRTIPTPKLIGTVVPIDSTNVVVALEDGVYKLDIETEEFTPMVSIEEGNEKTRLNDGKCDPAGRFWIGSMDYNASEPIGNLYMVDGAGKSELKLDSLIISNGIVWTADKKTMYHSETMTRTIRSFDYENETGVITNEITIINIPDTLGLPDGMAIDEEGMIWIGLWDGDGIVQYNPNSGELLQKVDVPAHNVTACAFGGENLDTLFITTSRNDMSEEEKARYPDAGSVFAVVPGVKGVKSDFFKPTK